MRLRAVAPVVFALALSFKAEALTPQIQRALNEIRPAELKGDLSFLASDELQGRYSPSPGIDIAAAFIASKFRAIGLQPVSGGDYFQIAKLVERSLPKVVTPLMSSDGGHPIVVEPAKFQVYSASAAAHLEDAPVVKIGRRDPAELRGVLLKGKVVLVPAPAYAALTPVEREAARAFDKEVSKSGALLEITIGKPVYNLPGSRLLLAEDVPSGTPPILRVDSPELEQALHTSSSMTLSLDLPTPTDHSFTGKNVIGILPGSDPLLKSTCVLVTAHYDHIGTGETGAALAEAPPSKEDQIFNGANDDGSGTVSVIEIARGLSRLHPARSVVFVTFFGEERGLVGSTYYGHHPVFPIAKTVADLNLEQVGRTDSDEGPQVATASITGYDYSTVATYLEDAGKLTGVELYKDGAASDAYFVRSDNAALAELGVPAHTLTTAFKFPDYHGVGDEWQKIDYENMAKVDRTVALAVLNIANSKKAPAWNEEDPKTSLFVKARKSGN